MYVLVDLIRRGSRRQTHRHTFDLLLRERVPLQFAISVRPDELSLVEPSRRRAHAPSLEQDP